MELRSFGDSNQWAWSGRRMSSFGECLNAYTRSVVRFRVPASCLYVESDGKNAVPESARWNAMSLEAMRSGTD